MEEGNVTQWAKEKRTKNDIQNTVYQQILSIFWLLHNYSFENKHKSDSSYVNF